jgi:sugar phosphate permease
MILGALEAGAFPGQYYLLSMWYSRCKHHDPSTRGLNRYLIVLDDMHKRFSIWYLIGVLGSAFGGILALLFTQMAGEADYAAWRWIFIMEGIITCLIGIAGYIFMIDFPENAPKAWRFLSQPEADFIKRRINRDRQDAENENFSWSRFLKPALDLKIWVFALMFLCVASSLSYTLKLLTVSTNNNGYSCATIVAYAIGFYLPLILNSELGFSVPISQVLSSPPYLFANVVMFIEGWVCDRYRFRGPCVVFNSLGAILGLCLMAYTHVPGVQYLGVLFVTAGCSANVPAVMVHQANNIRGPWKRAFSSASMISFGGMGGIAGSLVFRSQDAPKYLPGIYATIT